MFNKILVAGIVANVFLLCGDVGATAPNDNTSVKVHVVAKNSTQVDVLTNVGWNCTWKVAANGADCTKTYKTYRKDR